MKSKINSIMKSDILKVSSIEMQKGSINFICLKKDELNDAKNIDLRQYFDDNKYANWENIEAADINDITFILSAKNTY